MTILIVNTPGPQGADGNTILDTSGAPANTVGDNGDFANDPTAQVMYGPKTAGVWPAGVSYKGGNGTNGNTVLTTSGAPASNVGNNGDFAIDPTAQIMYGPKASGAWPAGMSIKGAIGNAGATGPQGPRGVFKRLLAAGTFYTTDSAAATLSNGTDTGGNALQNVMLPMGGGDIQLVYSNEQGTGPITITASLQYPANATTPIPATWNGGASSVTIPVGQIAFSDPIVGGANSGALVVPGDHAWLRTYVTVTSGHAWAMQHNSGLGQITGTTQSDQTLSAVFSYGTAGVAQIGPIAIIGTPLLASHSIGFMGDSILRGDGSGTADGGVASLIAGGLSSTTHAWANLSQIGFEGYTYFTNPTPYRQVLTYSDTVITNLGTNDLTYRPPANLAAFQASAIQWWWAMAGMGNRVLQGTLLPQTTSSDSWASLAGQTPATNYGAFSIRTNFNDWLRAGAPMLNGVAVAAGTTGAIIAGQVGHPLYATFEMANYVETAQDSGYWITNGTANYYTADGTHPTAAACAAIAAGFPTNLLA